MISRALLKVVGATAARAHLVRVARARRIDAREERHPEQSKDQKDETHQDADVAQLRQRLTQSDNDLVQALPRLHQAQNAQDTEHSQDAEEGEVGAGPRNQRDDHLEDRQGDDGPVELIPPISPVIGAPDAEELAKHLDDEGPGDQCRLVLEVHGVLLAHPIIGRAHQVQVVHHQPRREVADQLAGHKLAEFVTHRAGRGRAVTAAAFLCDLLTHHSEVRLFGALLE